MYDYVLIHSSVCRYNGLLGEYAVNNHNISVQLQYDMSDHESDGDDQFIVKKPTWRSEQVDQALKQLDNFAPLVRKRVNGSPSKRTNACDN